jgi:CheY-like chemotaxis protein/HPt (histidine-containing phosphotransfer) domain-containing protein
VILLQLGLLGYTADVTGDGRGALKRWESGDYALLLTDLNMPEMDGYDLSLAIRSGETGKRRIPIVALTANALKGEAKRCRAAGMDDYLSKPAQLADLKAMLEKWLPAAAESRPDSPDSPATPAPQVTAAGPVDVSMLKALVGGDPAVLREFLHDFRISAAKTATELRAACENGQAAQAGALAHKLKSSARSVGALALGELCVEIEQAGKAGQVEALTALLPRFETEMAAVDEYLGSL